MSRVVDAVSILLLVLAGVAFSLGVYALGEARDLVALYWLAVGGLLLRSATEILRPGSSSR